MNTYEAVIFPFEPCWDEVSVAPIDNFHWEKDVFVRPRSYAQLCAVQGKGIYAKLWSFEKDIAAVYENRDDPVYRDSCLEFFLCPIEGAAAPYANFEMNSKGVILSEYGSGRGLERSKLKELSDEAPVVTPFSLTEKGEKAWGVQLFVSEKLLSDITGKEFKVKPMTLRGNFYKCGDDTKVPHFGAFSPVGSEEKGFHNIDTFANIIFK